MERYIHSKKMKLFDDTKDIIHTYFDKLESKHPEVISAHVSLEHNNHAFVSNIHIHGKNMEVSSKAEDDSIYRAIDSSFDRVRYQIKKTHDKRIHH